MLRLSWAVTITTQNPHIWWCCRVVFHHTHLVGSYKWNHNIILGLQFLILWTRNSVSQMLNPIFPLFLFRVTSQLKAQRAYFTTLYVTQHSLYVFTSISSRSKSHVLHQLDILITLKAIINTHSIKHDNYYLSCSNHSRTKQHKNDFNVKKW